MDVCESWKVDLINFHCIRKASYKGQNSRLNPTRIRLPFDALTVPGAIFMVTWLQYLPTYDSSVVQAAVASTDVQPLPRQPMSYKAVAAKRRCKQLL